MIFKDILYKFTEIVQNQVEQTSPKDFVIRIYSAKKDKALLDRVLTMIWAELEKASLAREEINLKAAFVEPAEMAQKNGKIKQFMPWNWIS